MNDLSEGEGEGRKEEKEEEEEKEVIRGPGWKALIMGKSIVLGSGSGQAGCTKKHLPCYAILVHGGI